MNASSHKGGLMANGGMPTIALRISNEEIYNKLEMLAKEQNISKNMAVNMLLGFAFNEVERQKKKFVQKVVFESR